MRMKMGRVRGFAARLGIILSVVLGTFMAAGPSASAEGPVALYIGFIASDAEGNLPVRVRAVGASGAVCGTSMVEVSSDTVGFYSLVVASGDSKAGCPFPGEAIEFRLLYDPLDEGLRALTAGESRLRPGGNLTHLFPPSADVSGLAGWVGPTPLSGGRAVALIWDGPDGTPVDQALQTLGVEIAGAWHMPPGARRFLSYLPGAPAFAQTLTTVHAGDVVTVRAR